jgi:hypothetical protein
MLLPVVSIGLGKILDEERRLDFSRVREFDDAGTSCRIVTVLQKHIRWLQGLVLEMLTAP